MRSGQYVKQVEGYEAFIPKPLPPIPPINMDEELTRLLSDSDRALGRLDGITTVLPNPDLFVTMYVRHEAVLSSQIEGTQSTLEDVLQFDIDEKGERRPKDIIEVVNYVKAMNYGLKRLEEFPLSLRLIREIHERLLEGVRGENHSPGEFRNIQNWIGPQNCILTTAAFVPPPVHEMHVALDDFENFLHKQNTLPILIHCGLAHAQFETIHPFIDGNGRTGRLLITFLLCEQKILSLPLLYLSHFLKANKAEYYDHLMDIRNKGDWEKWLKFFLRGIYEVSQAATITARSILKMREEHRNRISEKLKGSALGLRLLDHLFERPLITVQLASQHMECAYVTANKLIEQFSQLGLLQEQTGWKRNRIYRYEPYLALFAGDAPLGRGPS